MQGLQQLSSSFPAAEGVGQSSFEKEGTSSQQETTGGGVTGMQTRNESEGIGRSFVSYLSMTMLMTFQLHKNRPTSHPKWKSALGGPPLPCRDHTSTLSRPSKHS